MIKGLGSNKIIRSVEITSKKVPNLNDIEEAKNLLSDYIDMATSPYNPRGLPSIDPLIILNEFLRGTNIIGVPHLSPRDGNKLMLISRIITSMKLGMSSFLVLRGDSINPRFGSRPVDEIDTLGLMRLLKTDEYIGNLVKKFGTPIQIGGILNPFRENEKDIVALKLNEGCSFFITHSIYDPEILKKDWIKKRNFKILAGFIPIFNKGSLEFYKDLDLTIPKDILEKMENSSNMEDFFFKLITNSVDELKGYIDGVHLMPIGRYNFVKKIMEVL